MWRRSAVLVSGSILACVACSDDPGTGAAADAGTDAGTDSGPAFEADPPGHWYAGDVHVHATGASNDTGGDSFPSDIARIGRERGLSFLVLTDHSNSTGSDTTTTDEDPLLFNHGPELTYWDTVASLSEPGAFLMLDGNELSPVAAGMPPTEPRGHVGCLPIMLEGFDTDTPFVDRPRGDVTGGDVLRQAMQRGCFTVVNHPYASAIWTAFDWTGTGYDAMEVWNGTLGLDPDDMNAHAAWRCDLLAGKSISPIGASDNHRVFTEPPGTLFNPALGFPSTSVFAPELTWPAVLAGLRAGIVTIHEGQSRLFIDGYDDARRRADGSAIRLIRLRGFVDGHARTPTLTLTRATDCDDPRPAGTPVQLTEDRLVDEMPIERGVPFEVVVPTSGEPGVYSAMVLTQDGHWGALSRALVIR